jgi:hypothetical protein
MMMASTSPFASQPKQLNAFSSNETDADGLASAWNGHRHFAHLYLVAFGGLQSGK